MIRFALGAAFGAAAITVLGVWTLIGYHAEAMERLENGEPVVPFGLAGV